MPLPVAKISNRMGASASDDTAGLRLVVRSVIAHVLGESREHPDVEDCTHEVLRRALEGRGRLRDGEALRPWVIGIARHVAIDARRARRRARAREENASELSPALERLVDPAPGPDERAASAERARRVDAAMRSLPDGPRTALQMFHVEGMGYQQIAQRLAVPLGTVATWVNRGRRAIAQAVDEERSLP